MLKHVKHTKDSQSLLLLQWLNYQTNHRLGTILKRERQRNIWEQTSCHILLFKPHNRKFVRQRMWTSEKLIVQVHKEGKKAKPGFRSRLVWPQHLANSLHCYGCFPSLEKERLKLKEIKQGNPKWSLIGLDGKKIILAGSKESAIRQKLVELRMKCRR